MLVEVSANSFDFIFSLEFNNNYETRKCNANVGHIVFQCLSFIFLTIVDPK